MTTGPLIVGGGPAGAAAAITLARGGARPLLLERHAEAHDTLCGGFLGWDALRRLDAIGIDAAALGARPITRLRLVAGDRLVEVVLPSATFDVSAPASGRLVERHCLPPDAVTAGQTLGVLEPD